MAKFSYEHGSTSVILRVKIPDSSRTDGSGLTGLAFGAGGLIISTIADVEAAATVYTVANLEDITTLGTYAAPTASKCRFKEVDATNHPGIYEIHLADARYAVTNARSVIVSISGATNAAQTDAEIQLEPVPTNVKEWKGSVPGDLISGLVSTRPTLLGAASIGSGAFTSTAKADLRSVVRGTADSGTTTTLVDAARTEAGTDHWNDCWLMPTSGAIAFQTRLITGFDPATDTITVGRAFTQAIGTNTYEILPAGAVLVGGLGTTARADVNAEVDNALDTGIPGSPTAGSVNERLKTMDDAYTAARAVFLDNLNVGGLVAAQADVAAITQAQRVRLAVSGQLERPDSGSVTYRVWIYVYDETHIAEDLDSNPTVTAENNAGTDRSSGLGTVTKPASTTGRYYVDYTVASAHAIEAIVFKVDATEGAVTTQYAAATLIVDTTAVDYTATDRADAAAMKASIDELHDNRLTAARATALDNLDVAVSTRSTLDSAGAQAACDAALVAIHLDHLLAADTPTPLPGVAGSILNDLLEDNAGTWRFNAGALAQAPGGGGSDPEVLKSGTIAASPAPTATTLSATVLSEATTDFWINKVVHITSGVANGLTARISAFDPAQDQITFTPALVVAPVATDTFDILRKHIEAPGAGATDFTGTEQNVILKAARKLVNKKRHTIATGVNEFLDDAGTSVIQTETPTESGGVVTVTPS